MKDIFYDCDHCPDPWHCLGTCRYRRDASADRELPVQHPSETKAIPFPTEKDPRSTIAELNRRLGNVERALRTLEVEFYGGGTFDDLE